MNTAKVRLLGEELTISGEAPREQLERLAMELEGLLRRIMEEGNLRAQPTRVALLAALNMLEELDSIRGEYEELKREHETLLGQMVRRIEYALKQE